MTILLCEKIFHCINIYFCGAHALCATQIYSVKAHYICVMVGLTTWG